MPGISATKRGQDMVMLIKVRTPQCACVNQQLCLRVSGAGRYLGPVSCIKPHQLWGEEKGSSLGS